MYDTQNPLRVWAKPHTIFIAVTFGFSWLIWIGAWLISQNIGTGGILYNAELLWAPLSGSESVTSALFLVSLLSLTGVYGPLLGAYIAAKADGTISWRDIWKSATRWKGNKSHLTKLFIILAVVVGIPSILTIIFTNAAEEAPGVYTSVVLLLLFFISQIITSGTEEIGWRGYLTEKLLPGRDFWDAGWLVGIVWAVWHFPVLLIMFLQQGMVHVQILGSLVGFTLGIVAISILHTWFYAQTRQVSLNIFIHALFNAVPLTLTVLYLGSPVAVLSNVLLWFVVIYIKRRADKQGRKEIVEY